MQSPKSPKNLTFVCPHLVTLHPPLCRIWFGCPQYYRSRRIPPTLCLYTSVPHHHPQTQCSSSPPCNIRCCPFLQSENHTNRVALSILFANYSTGIYGENIPAIRPIWHLGSSYAHVIMVPTVSFTIATISRSNS